MDIMNVSVSGQCAGKFWAVTVMGCLKALKDKTITLEEAEKCMFTPFMAMKVEKAGCNPFISEMILKCCELENIRSIIPARYEETINGLIRETEAWLTEQSETPGRWVLSIKGGQQKNAAGS